MKLFVAGLPFDMDDEEFKEIFEAYGRVTSAAIVFDREFGKSRGFGFVDMPDAAEAEKTIKALDGGSLEGRTMTVKPAVDKPKANGRRALKPGTGNRNTQHDL